MTQPAPSADSQVQSSPRLRPLLELAVLLGLVAIWFLLIRTFGQGDVYAMMGPFGCVVALVCVGLRPRPMLQWLRPSWRALAIGVGAGVIMTALTYPVFRLAVQLVPSLNAEVKGLYQGAYSTTLPKAFAWLIALAIAEELLFRGVLPDVLQHWLSPRSAFSLSLVIYALAQLGTGSWVVLLMAAGCGTVWTVMRVRCQSVLAPLCAHLIWSPMLLLFYPVI